VSSDASLEAYFKEATTWDGDRVAQANRAARNARILAGACLTLAVTAVIAVSALTPLKSVEPFLIRVDNTSGVVDVIPGYGGETTLGEPVTRFLLTHYVTTCERFALPVAEQDYAECGAFHAAQRNQQWASLWATGNPESPLNRFRDGTTVRSEVRSVTFFERATGVTDLAQVRFTRLTRPGGEGAERATQWIATLHYAFGKPSSDPKTRRWNPLGFRILNYRLEPEIGETRGSTTSAQR
jgi:type IV secretion system protein VirB8